MTAEQISIVQNFIGRPKLVQSTTWPCAHPPDIEKFLHVQITHMIFIWFGTVDDMA